jgi:hypothetical protein
MEVNGVHHDGGNLDAVPPVRRAYALFIYPPRHGASQSQREVDANRMFLWP